MAKQKISVTEYNQIILDARVAHAEYKRAEARAMNLAEEYEAIPNCPACKGAGEVETTGDPAFSQGDPVIRECSKCEGKGYV